MNSIATAERRDFRRSIEHHLKTLDEAEAEAERVEQRAKYLTQPGEEFHPWTFDNFEEAIGNAPEAERKVMFATIAAAVDSNLKNDNNNHLALVSVRCMVERYWLEIATKKAERELP